MSPAPPNKGDPTPRVNEELLKSLIAEGLISGQEAHAAQSVAHRRRMFVEEVLVQMGCLSEADLLKAQANFYKTQFVSTQKLASAPIDKTVLKMVPQKLAERYTVFPVVFDAKKGLLKVLTVQPGDLEMIKNLQFAARVNDVQELVARPAAIAAAIDKHYQGNTNAFFDIREPETVNRQIESQEQLMQQYEQRLMTNTAISIPASLRGEHLSIPGPSEKPARRSRRPPSSPRLSISVKRKTPRPSIPATADTPGEREALVPGEKIVGRPASGRPASGRAAAFSPSANDYFETLNVLVALIENGREGLRSHSALVARITKQVCERLSMQAEDADNIAIAAYLHDLGKPARYHLTALNVAEYADYQDQARKAYLGPVRLFEATRLPQASVNALAHLYERFDGTGFPDRLAGKDIDLGARILAIVETHADLVGNPNNQFGKKFSPSESYEMLLRFQNAVFDPSLVSILKATVLGQDLRAKLLAGSGRALIVDPDPEETMMLEVRLVDQGFDVTIARGSNEVEALLKTNEFDVVISEVDLQPQDGFSLLSKIRSEGKLQLPFVFVTKESDGGMVQRGFELGADDYITKPASAELVALKIRQVLDSAKRKKKSRGVSGSLEEMALPDVVQVLYHGRKSGKLLISSGSKRGEVLFADGQICDASFGAKRREEAFYDMLSLTGGHFELDPDFHPSERLIELSPESLLLEGMRRLDESRK